MHPLIRILSLLIFVALAPWLPSSALLAAAVVLLLNGLLRPSSLGLAMLHALRRIRWLLLSLAILYLWFTPGEVLAPALGLLSPTGAGLALALHRGGVLVTMVGAAAVLLTPVPAPELAAALRRLLNWPVRTTAGERCADRISLLLAELPRVEQRVRDSLRRDGQPGGQPLAARVASLFAVVEMDAAESAHGLPPLAHAAPVPHAQWLYPLALLALGAGAMIFSGGQV